MMRVRGRTRGGRTDEVVVEAFTTDPAPYERGVFVWTLEDGDPYRSGGVMLTPGQARRLARALESTARRVAAHQARGANEGE